MSGTGTGSSTSKKKSRIPRFVGPWTTQTKKRPIEVEEKNCGKNVEMLPKCRRRILDKDVKTARTDTDQEDVQVHFEPDSKALASILSNEGITAHFCRGPVATRAGGQGTDVGSGRPSTVYYKAPTNRMSIIESHQEFKAFMVKQRMSEYHTAKPNTGWRTPGKYKTPGKKPDQQHPAMSKTPSAVYFSPSKQHVRNCITPKPFNFKSPHHDAGSPLFGPSGHNKTSQKHFSLSHKKTVPTHTQKPNPESAMSWKKDFSNSATSRGEVKYQEDLASHLDLLSISNKGCLFKLDEKDKTASNLTAFPSQEKNTSSKLNLFGSSSSSASSALPLSDSQKGNVFPSSASVPFSVSFDVLKSSVKETAMEGVSVRGDLGGSQGDSVKSSLSDPKEMREKSGGDTVGKQVFEHKENMMQFQGSETPIQLFRSLSHNWNLSTLPDNFSTPPLQSSSHTNTESTVNQSSSNLFKVQGPSRTPTQFSHLKTYANPSPGPARVQVDQQPSPAPSRLQQTASNLGLQPPSRTPVPSSCLKKKPAGLFHGARQLTESTRKKLRWADIQDSDDDF